ncbi:hypothetical protein FQN49_005450 [Arthroderma sp. PD_2]|nr:hypothetical protein FQN49_005450 [Arthroderma sp. PD_2]
MITLKTCLLFLVSSGLAFGAAPGARFRRRGTTPTNPHDKSTTSYCTWWVDYNEGLPCDQVLQTNSITLEQFQRWVSGGQSLFSYTQEQNRKANPQAQNPTITGSCDGMTVVKSYCVEATFEPTPTASSTGPSGPTGTPGTIETPLPTQPEIAPNCDAFHLVQQGEDCGSISADAYACVSIVGHEPSKTTSSASQPTPTKPSNGIETPLPTQPKIVDNCDKYHLVESGEGCADCLWADAYACVSTIGHEPKATPTKPSNGIETPLPTQPDIVNSCNKFYLAQSGDSCATIAFKYGITLSDFTKWNPKAGNTCAGFWANAYACVSITGYTPKPSATPTPTKRPNGTQTPTPIQNGMVKNCNKFHFVDTGNTCPVVQAKYKATLANLFKWNPAIKADCTGLWAKTYLCVGTL